MKKRSASVAWNVLILIVFTILVSGCAVGPNYIKPTVPEPKEWMQKEDPKIKSEPTDFSQWWTAFNDPTLDKLVQSAYEQNLPLQIAGLRILEARAQLGIAVGEQYPQSQAVGAGLTYNNLSENMANTLGIDTTYTDVNVGFDAIWELDIWGKIRRAVESSIASLDVSIASYDDFLVSLTAEVARTYVIVRTVEERLRIARDNVQIQRRSLDIAEARFEGGAVTELDVTQARSLLKDTEASIPRFQAELRRAKNALAILLGRLPGEIDNILVERGQIPTVPPEITVGIPAELLRRRPDIRLAERRLAGQSALIGVAKADLYPHFTLFGSIGLRASDGRFSAEDGVDGGNLDNLFESASFEVFAGPSISWNIFNYGRLKNSVRVQDARFQQLVVSYENTVLEAAQEVEDAMVSFLRSQEEVQFLSDSVDASNRSVDLSLLQYREGLVNYQRVLDTQRFLTFQQTLLAERTGSVALNVVAMYKALGGGWEIRAGKDFVPIETKEEMRQRTNWGNLLSPEKLKTVPAEEAVDRWHGPDW